jgi:hypothetical protein
MDCLENALKQYPGRVKNEVKIEVLEK